MDRPTKPSGRHAVRLCWDEIITRLSYRFNFLAIRWRIPHLNWRAGMKKPAGLRRRASDCRQRCAWSSHRQAASLYIKKIAAMTTRPDRPQMILLTNRKGKAKPPLQKNHRDGGRRA